MSQQRPTADLHRHLGGHCRAARAPSGPRGAGARPGPDAAGCRRPVAATPERRGRAASPSRHASRRRGFRARVLRAGRPPAGVDRARAVAGSRSAHRIRTNSPRAPGARNRSSPACSHCSALDPDDLAWVSDDLPEDVMAEVRESLGEIDRTLLQQADAYPPQSVGRLMSLDVATVRESQSIGDVLQDLQARADLPDHLGSPVCRGQPESAPRLSQPSVARARRTAADRRRNHGGQSACLAPGGHSRSRRTCLRALRPRLDARRQRSRQTRRPPDRRCRRRLHPRDAPTKTRSRWPA